MLRSLHPVRGYASRRTTQQREELPLVAEDGDHENDDEQIRRAQRRDHRLLTMAQNHLLVFVLFLYGIYAIGRYFGWKPRSNAPPRSYLLQLHWNATSVRDFVTVHPMGEGHGTRIQENNHLSLLDLEI